MPLYQLSDEIIFPPPQLALEDGLLAIGGDLRPERIIKAYSMGIFPWYGIDSPILWWSPNPRMLLIPDQFKLRKSLRNTLNKKLFELRFDTQFEEVIRQCAKVRRKGQDETWITEEMLKAYIQLHHMGLCHSVETYYKDELVGGLYGISLGKAFFGESMFHTKADASKVALYSLVEKAKEWDFLFIDAQQETDHLKSLGAKPVAREKFLTLLDEAMKHPTKQGIWK